MSGNPRQPVSLPILEQMALAFVGHQGKMLACIWGQLCEKQFPVS